MAAGCCHGNWRAAVISIGIHGFRAANIRPCRLQAFQDRTDAVALAVGGAPMPMRNCNQAFPGVCDSAVLEQAVKQAQTPGRFVYALMLVTHLLLDLHQAEPLPAALRGACTASDAGTGLSTSEQAGRPAGAADESTLAASEARRSWSSLAITCCRWRGHQRAFVAHRVPMFIDHAALSGRTPEEARPAAQGRPS